MEIGNTLSKSRIEKGWTQQQLSEESGISLRTIQRIENNQVTAQLHTIKRLEEVLGVDISTKEDDQPLFTLMGVSALIVIIPIVGNILIPLVFLLLKRKTRESRKLGGAFIFLQIIWTVLWFSFSVLAFNLSQFIWGESNPGNFNPLNIVFILFWVINLILILLIGIQAKSGKNTLLSKLPSFF